jgi:Pentapeptide repeats (8 copies)
MASDKQFARLKDGASAWNQWRREEPLIRPDLQGLSLTLAQKQWGETSGGPINFTNCVLRDADLRHATLIRANLSGATLAGANLSGARLQNANLRNTNLSLARFDDADMGCALLEGADLRGADLSGARNLSSSQIELAEGDARTLLPAQLVAPKAWRSGAFAALASAETPRDTAAAHAPAAARSLRLPQPQVAVDLAKRALERLPEPRRAVDAAGAAIRSRLPDPRRAMESAGAAIRSRLPDPKRAVKSVGAAIRNRLPNPRRSVESAGAAIRSRLPDPRRAVDAAGAVLQRLPMPTPKMVLATALAGLAGLALLFGIGHLLSTGVIDAGMFGQRAPGVVAQSHAIEQGAPQRLAVGEPGAATAVHDVPVGLQTSPVATAVEAPPALPAGVVEGLPVGQSASPVVALEGAAARPTEQPPPDTTVRLAFALGTEDIPGTKGTSINAPVGGDTAQAYIESYVGQPVKARSVDAPMKRVDLPKPKPATKTPVKEVWVEPAGAPATTPVQEARAEPLEAPAPQVAHAPTNVVEYLQTPTRSTDWIMVFIKDFYLSDTTLDESAIRTVYSDYVDYFGESKTSLEKVAREKADYYRHWPTRHYALVPGSIAIKWRTPEIADISFTYDFKVSAPQKKTSSGRGRAHLTLDLRGSTGRIVREDGEVLAHN